MRIFWKSFYRRLRSSPATLLMCLLLLAVTAAIVLLLSFYEREHAAISATEAGAEIRCVVTDAQGNVDNIGVLSVYADMLTGRQSETGCTLDDCVRSLDAMAVQPLILPDSTELRQIYCLSSDPELRLLPGSAFTLDPDWDVEALQGSEPVCLITDDLQEQVEDGAILIASEIFGCRTLRVMGTVHGAGSSLIWCPFYVTWDAAQNIVRPMDSCSFVLRDNQRLSESKLALFETFVHPRPGALLDGLTAGLIVQDETYLATMSELKSHLHLLRVLLPVLLALTAGIALLGTRLLNRKRLPELAVMRCLGISKSAVFRHLLLEQMLLALMGCGLGLAGSALALRGLPPGTLQALLWIMAAATLGTSISALHLAGTDPIQLMKTEEA